MGLGEVVAQANAQGVRVQLDPGVVKSIDWSEQTVTVNVAGGFVVAQMAGDQPTIGATVWVLTVGELRLTLGRPAGPAYGTVQGNPVNGFVPVRGDDGRDYSLPYSFGATLANGNRVALEWNHRGRVEQRLTGEITAAGQTSFLPPPDTSGGTDDNPGGVKEYERQFFVGPGGTGSWNAQYGWAKDDVYFASGNVGAWFFGTQIADTIPDNAEILAVSIYIEVIHSTGQTIKLGTHTYAGKPSGSIPISNHVDLGAGVGLGFKGNVALPTSFGDMLKTGAALGLGTSGPGYRIMKGLPLASSGAVTIKWKV